MHGVGNPLFGRTRIVMRHAVVTIVRIGVFLALLATPRGAISADADPVDRARALIAARNERQAAEVLVDALADAPEADRGPIISLLRETYSTLAKLARERGQDRDAALYQDNLDILNHGPAPSGPAPSADPEPDPPPVPAATTATAPPRQSAPKAIASPTVDAGNPAGTTAKPLPPPQRLPKPEPLPPSASPAPESQGIEARPEAAPRGDGSMGPAARTSPDHRRQLNQADRAFASKQYEAAGRLYAQLAARNELPANRNEVWAYCRWTEIVRKINAKPRTAEEWDAIEAEIKKVREINPDNWYGEYLLSRVAEARKARRSLFPRKPRNEKLLVRGSEPEEIDVKLPSRDKPNSPPKPGRHSPQPLLGVDEPTPEPAQPSAPAPRPPGASADPRNALEFPGLADADHSPQAAIPPTGSAGRWQVRETDNFRVFHHSPELAERAAQVAEAARSAQGKRWTGPALSRNWAPKCEVYLYPEAQTFAKMTGQPETSPGFTTMGANGGRIISRRINLRADHPRLLSAILPHEVTHVVLADMFPEQPIPRWADEGMAVLAEPPSEVRSRSAELRSPLEESRIFTVADLVALDYPDAKDWSTYYAQSVSLTRFLVEQGGPRDFIRFLQASQRSSIDAALRETYKINGLAELQNLWLTYAREQAVGPDVAAAGPAADEESGTR
jgi:hypothetical protein